MNRCIFEGHLGVDPSFNTTNGGDAVANIFFLTNAPGRPDGQGGWTSPKADAVSVAIFKPKAIEAVRELSKGSKVVVVASAGIREWTDKATGEVRKELQLAISGKYPGQGIFASMEAYEAYEADRLRRKAERAA